MSNTNTVDLPQQMADFFQGHTKVLLLGGTAEGKKLQSLLSAREIPHIYSVAGVTQNTAHTGTPHVHTGGFGGIEGLTRYITENHFDLVIDATHPYATRMSEHAAMACQSVHISLYRICRPAWTPTNGDIWISCTHVGQAVQKLNHMNTSTVFIALGARHVTAFQGLKQTSYFRTVAPLEPAVTQQNPNIHNIVQTGPFSEDQERDLFKQLCIECLIAKNSGGPWSYAKIAVARDLNIPILMIDRPKAQYTYGTEITLEDFAVVP